MHSRAFMLDIIIPTLRQCSYSITLHFQFPLSQPSNHIPQTKQNKKTQIRALSHKPASDLYSHACQSLYSNHTFTTLIDRFTSLRFGRISVIKGTYL